MEYEIIIVSMGGSSVCRSVYPESTVSKRRNIVSESLLPTFGYELLTSTEISIPVTLGCLKGSKRTISS